MAELDDIRSREDLLARVKTPDPLNLDTSVLRRGIDNYHIDIRLSDKFVLHARELISKVVKRVVAGSRPLGSQTDELEDFRDAYEDMMTTTLHRTKTDLTSDQLRVLHFGVIKFLLKEVRANLDGLMVETEETIAQQQYAGSRSLLATQERFAWMRKHYDDFLFRSSRGIMQLIQREENGLRELRQQILPNDSSDLVNVMFNPMLCATSPSDIGMLTDCYALWPDGGNGFAAANLRIEDTLAESFPEFEIKELRATLKIAPGETEVFDTMHGLFSAQEILGPSADQSDKLREEFCWLEHPGNIRLLFDSAVHERALRNVKEAEGLKAQWALKSEFKKMLKTLAELRKKTFSDMEFRESVACYLLRDNWSGKDQQLLEMRLACAYVAGHDSKKILDRLDMSKEGLVSLIKRLDEVADNLGKIIKEEGEELFLRLLTDVCRYRLHLKYFRLAHRALNRINIVTEPQEIQLARAGGALYELLGFDENQESQSTEAEIIHHTIIKADVRGSTTVIADLLKKDLNPASYFSLRFFNPITERLANYGAVKVFIEGDAVILGIYEESNAPDQWYSVSRACGLAKEILDIVASKNTHARQTGVPGLEVGIGICFRDSKPLFLFDEDKPIMISSAISDADRLSSCSWRLRQQYEGKFNVEVLDIADDEAEHGEKGQKQLRYNLNGVLLSTEAFKKLTSEIPLKKMKLKAGDATETMFVGRFPDVLGKERDLVIREGKVGVWQLGRMHPGDGSSVFYEVLPNSKLASQVVEAAKKA